MQIAIFGGSFNPPHVAHQMLALYVLETAPVDQLWVVPTFKHPFDKPLAPYEDRHEMAVRAMRPLGDRARVSDIERQLGGASRTLRTMQALAAAHPGDQFHLVIGADLVREIDSWHGADQLKKTVPLIVVGRGGETGSDRFEVAMPAVSSTVIRERFRTGQPVEGLVPRAVLDYIYARGLYDARESA